MLLSRFSVAELGGEKDMDLCFSGSLADDISLQTEIKL
jgi:hypothetical protein